MRLLKIWLLLLLLSWVATAKPAPSGPVRDGHVEVELLSPQAQWQPGQPLQVGVLFKMDPHWHLYWKNPGASGFPPKFEWSLPASPGQSSGWQAGPIAWPVPKRFVQADLQQFVYDDQVLLTSLLQPPPNGKPPQNFKVGLKLSWLACSDTCVPGQAQLQLEWPQARPAPQQLFDTAQQQLPASSGNIELRAWKLGPGQAFIEYPGESGDLVDFFPHSDQANMESAPQWAPGKGLTLGIQPGDQRIQGVLAIQNSSGRLGVDLDIPLLAEVPSKPLTSPDPLKQPAPSPFGALMGALLAALLGGMILNLMPCVFPVLSLKALSLVRQNQDGGNHPAWGQAGSYTLGVLVSVWAIAAPLLLFKGTGQGWGYQMQSPVFVTGLAALFLGIALNLFGLFEVGTSLTRLAELPQGKKGLAESFWSGAVATVSATPCTGPFMASALGYALSQSAWVGGLIFTALGLGIAFPYALLCLVPASRRWLPRPGAWMESFKQAMGFPMLAAMIWFLYILCYLLSPEGLALVLLGLLLLSLAAWIMGRWGYSPQGKARWRGKVLTALVGLVGLGLAIGVALSPDFQPQSAGQQVPRQEGGLTWVPYSPEALQQLRSQGKAVFLDFTASWCINCKANELGTLRQAKVVEAFKSQGIVTMKADWTRRDETITRALSQFGRSGVPLYVFYPAGPQSQPKILPELLTPQIVLQALQP